MLSVRCSVCLSVCNVGVLLPNGCMDQDEAWHGGTPRPRPQCVRWGLSSSPKGHGPCLLWPNGWMDQDAASYGRRPRPRRQCVRWGPSSPPQKGAQQPPHFSTLVHFGQTVAHLSMQLSGNLSCAARTHQCQCAHKIWMTSFTRSKDTIVALKF